MGEFAILVIQCYKLTFRRSNKIRYDAAAITTLKMFNSKCRAIDYLYSLFAESLEWCGDILNLLFYCSDNLDKFLFWDRVQDGLQVVLVKNLIAKLIEVLADIPSFIIVDSLLCELHHPLLQLLVVRYLVNE